MDESHLNFEKNFSEVLLTLFKLYGIKQTTRKILTIKN